VIGLLGGKILPQYFRAENAQAVDVDLASKAADFAKPSLRRALKISVVWIVVWALPLTLAGLFLGSQHTVFREGIFFSKAAVVTFGGAYAVLPYVSQQAVENYHWLGAGQMLDGLGLAETTPGPPGRDHTGPLDHGVAVCRFSRRVESSWKSAATGERDTRRACHDLDNLCALFSLGVFRCAVHREITRERVAHLRSLNRHRGCRRCDFESRRLVRRARHLSRDRKCRLVCVRCLRDRIRRNARLEMEYCSRRAQQWAGWPDLHAGWFPLKIGTRHVQCIGTRHVQRTRS